MRNISNIICMLKNDTKNEIKEKSIDLQVKPFP